MLLSRINALSLVVPFNLSLSICHITLSTLISAKLRLLRSFGTYDHPALPLPTRKFILLDDFGFLPARFSVSASRIFST